eukprot:gb/GECG01008075.1/.p1 GENE.gb/GECG01008075.1/~~gb/GECG01008075.1/.p1  ORF type:complete len:404 (+),score=53.29 gb/GECG01008075.1/:1-1212(+)
MDPTEVATAIDFYNYVQSKQDGGEEDTHQQYGMTPENTTRPLTRTPHSASAEHRGKSSAAAGQDLEVYQKTDTSSTVSAHIDASSASSSDITPTGFTTHDQQYHQCQDKRGRLTQTSQGNSNTSAGIAPEQLFQEYFADRKPGASAATKWLSLAKVSQEWPNVWFPVLRKHLSSLDDFLPDELQRELLQECTSHLSGEDKESLQDEVRRPSKRACVASPLSMTPSAASDPPVMTSFQSPQKASECSGMGRSSSGLNDVRSSDIGGMKGTTSDLEEPHSSEVSRASGYKSSSSLLGGKRGRRKSEGRGVKSDTLRSTPKAKLLAIDMVRSITERLLNPSGACEALKEALTVYFELSKPNEGSSEANAAEQTMKECLDTISNVETSVVSPSTLHSLFLLAFFFYN